MIPRVEYHRLFRFWDLHSFYNTVNDLGDRSRASGKAKHFENRKKETGKLWTLRLGIKIYSFVNHT